MSGLAVVIPVRGRHGGKSRLAPVLDPLDRDELVRSMARHVLSVVEETIVDGPIFLVTRDPDLDWLATDLASRVEVVHQPETRQGLNPAIDLGREAALERRAERLLVLSADLPLLRSADVERMVESVAPVAIGSDRFDEGTNALLLGTPGVMAGFRFQFGVNSSQLHECESKRLGVASAPVQTGGIGLDLDTPDDWAMLSAEARELLLRHDDQPGTLSTRMLLLESA